jgi:hypothetical protein
MRVNYPKQAIGARDGGSEGMVTPDVTAHTPARPHTCWGGVLPCSGVCGRIPPYGERHVKAGIPVMSRPTMRAWMLSVPS